MEKVVAPKDPNSLENYLVRLIAELPIALRSQELLLQHAIQLICEEFGFESGMIALRDEHDVNLLTVRATTGPGTGCRGSTIPRGIGALWDVLQSGSPLLIPSQSRELLGRQQVPGRSGIYAPLILHDHVIGVLSVHGTHSGAFTGTDLWLLSKAAQCLAGAIAVSSLHEQLKELAMTDSLTGLANRRSFVERLSAEIARSHRTRSPLSIVLIDLDGFKMINDAHGHGVGDDVLIQVAKTLAGSCRASDLASRYGGDEFILLLPDTSRAQAEELVDRTRIARLSVAATPDAPVALSASWGIATWPLDADSVDGLLRMADHRLYAMKAGTLTRKHRQSLHVQEIFSTSIPLFNVHFARNFARRASRLAMNVCALSVALVVMVTSRISEDPRSARIATPTRHEGAALRYQRPFTARTNYMSLAGYRRYLRRSKANRGSIYNDPGDSKRACAERRILGGCLRAS